MKTIKLIALLLILACFVGGMLVSCAQENFQCSTYHGHYSNLHAKYKNARR